MTVYIEVMHHTGPSTTYEAPDLTHEAAVEQVAAGGFLTFKNKRGHLISINPRHIKIIRSR